MARAVRTDIVRELNLRHPSDDLLVGESYDDDDNICVKSKKRVRAELPLLISSNHVRLQGRLEPQRTGLGSGDSIGSSDRHIDAFLGNVDINGTLSGIGSMSIADMAVTNNLDLPCATETANYYPELVYDVTGQTVKRLTTPSVPSSSTRQSFLKTSTTTGGVRTHSHHYAKETGSKTSTLTEHDGLMEFSNALDSLTISDLTSTTSTTNTLKTEYLEQKTSPSNSILTNSSIKPNVDVAVLCGDTTKRWFGVYTQYLENKGTTESVVLNSGLLPNTPNHNQLTLGYTNRSFKDLFIMNIYSDDAAGTGTDINVKANMVTRTLKPATGSDSVGYPGSVYNSAYISNIFASTTYLNNLVSNGSGYIYAHNHIYPIGAGINLGTSGNRFDYLYANTGNFSSSVSTASLYITINPSSDVVIGGYNYEYESPSVSFLECDYVGKVVKIEPGARSLFGSSPIYGSYDTDAAYGRDKIAIGPGVRIGYLGTMEFDMLHSTGLKTWINLSRYEFLKFWANSNTYAYNRPGHQQKASNYKTTAIRSTSGFHVGGYTPPAGENVDNFFQLDPGYYKLTINLLYSWVSYNNTSSYAGIALVSGKTTNSTDLTIIQEFPLGFEDLHTGVQKHLEFFVYVDLVDGGTSKFGFVVAAFDGKLDFFGKNTGSISSTNNQGRSNMASGFYSTGSYGPILNAGGPTYYSWNLSTDDTFNDQHQNQTCCVIVERLFDPRSA